MDTQGRRNIDPADQWVLDPATGTYQLRLEPDAPADGGPPQSGPQQSGPHEDATASHVPSPASPASHASPAPPASPASPASHGRRAARTGGTRAAAAPPGGGGSRGRRRAKPSPARRKKTLAWTGGAAGFVLLAVGVGSYLASQHVDDNITTVDVGDAGSTSVTHAGPMNILVIGTDSRQGLGDAYGDPGGIGHADTTVLFHLSADRTNVTALSIPGDLVTSIPDCPTKQKGGSAKVVKGTPAGTSSPKFDESLAQDGRDPGCTMRLVTQLTGLPVDHFMMVDFTAVKTLSSAVGGVDVCLARPLSDPKSHLDLGAGPHRLEGEQALEFVRTRNALPNRSDLERVKLQQSFLGAMIREMRSGGTLTDPKKLWKLADTASKALTVDTPIGSVASLNSLAGDLGKVNAKNITFATLPVVDNPDDKAHTTVVVDKSRASQLLAMMKADVSLSRTSKTPAAPDPRLTGPKATPHNTRVNIRNGSGVFGAAQDMVGWLQIHEGVNRSANIGDAPADVPKTTLEYGPNQADQARSLAAMMGLPASALHEGTVDAAPLAYMTLTLGKDFTAPGTPIAPPTTLPSTVPTTRADSAACVG